MQLLRLRSLPLYFISRIFIPAFGYFYFSRSHSIEEYCHLLSVIAYSAQYDPRNIVYLRIAWLLYSGLALINKVRREHSTNGLLVVVPIRPMNVFQIVIEPLVFNILDGLPFQFVNFRSWDFHDKAASHVEVGDTLAYITPRETLSTLAILELSTRSLLADRTLYVRFNCRVSQNAEIRRNQTLYPEP